MCKQEKSTEMLKPAFQDNCLDNTLTHYTWTALHPGLANLQKASNVKQSLKTKNRTTRRPTPPQEKKKQTTLHYL